MNVVRGLFLDYLEFRWFRDNRDEWCCDDHRARALLDGMGGLMGEW